MACLAALGCDGKGVVFRDGVCSPCPADCCYCPGGSRIWPLPGYWSENADDTPLRCLNPAACLGITSHDRQTDRCAAGYAGSYCSRCAAGYYQAFESCIACPSNALAHLSVLVIAAVVLYSVMAAGVAALHVRPLGIFVSSLVAFQQLTQVGRQAATRVAADSPWLAAALNYVGVLSFDVEFASAECATNDPVGFLTLFWATLVMGIVVTLMFVGASALRAAYIVAKHVGLKACLGARLGTKRAGALDAAGRAPAPEADENLRPPRTFMQHFSRRAVRSVMIAGTVMYFQICTRVFQGFSCVKDGTDTWRLRAQLSITCFEGQHLAAVPIMFLVLAFYCIGFPAACFVVLLRFYRRGLLGNVEISKRWGSIYSAMKSEYYWFKMLSFATTFVFTLVAATTDGNNVRLLTSGLLFEAALVLLVVLFPYANRLQNVYMGALSFLKVLVPLVLLGLADRSSTAFVALLACTAAVFPITFGAVFWHRVLRASPLCQRVRSRCGLGEAEDAIAEKGEDADYDRASNNADSQEDDVFLTDIPDGFDPDQWPAVTMEAIDVPRAVQT